MIFKLRRIKGRSRKTYKEYVSPPYRIVWRSERFGIKLTPGFQACILIGKQYLFVERHGIYKTLAAAQKACERHAKTQLEPKKKKRNARVKRK